MPPVPKAAGAAAGAGARKPPHRTSRPKSKRQPELGDPTPQKLDDVPVDSAPGAGFKADPGTTDPADELVEPTKPTPDPDPPRARGRGRARFNAAADKVNSSGGGPGVPSSLPTVGGQDAAGAVLGIIAVAFLINVLKGTSTAWLRAKFLNDTPVKAEANQVGDSAARAGASASQGAGSAGGGVSGAQNLPSAYTQQSTTLAQALAALNSGVLAGAGGAPTKVA